MITLMNATIYVHDRAYTTWSLFDKEIMQSEQQVTQSNVHPIQNKLFNGDQILVHKDNVPTLLNSPIRKSTFLSGVLILAQNKTYGRTANKKRLLYRVVPEDKHLPFFLAPYEMKSSFNKAWQNKFILFKFESWNNEHPLAQITEVIGNVDHLQSYYEYQLYCKCLHSSLKEMSKLSVEMAGRKTMQEYIVEIRERHPNIQDRTHIKNIFTIDPVNSTDYDDALSIQYHNESNTTTITTYITNVFVWLETMNLWNAFSNRTATIYLPDRKCPMLPNIIIDSFCSLRANTIRFAMALDFTVDNATAIITNYKINPVMIRVANNYVYSESSLLSNASYHHLLNMTTKIKSVETTSSVMTSHELVAYWMIATNTKCAEFMLSHKKGIYRTMKDNKEIISTDQTQNQNHEHEHVVQKWLRCSGQYAIHSNDEQMNHCFMKTSTYIQITSPIRRIVDLLNQIILFDTLDPCSNKSSAYQQFVEKWIHRLDYINTSMRSIRKMQMDCALLNHFMMNRDCQAVYCGIVFDKVHKSNGLFGYMVYLEDIKLLSRMTSVLELDTVNTKYNFKVYLFENEDSTKKKIRVALSDNNN